jgi:hypothetical protein
MRNFSVAWIVSDIEALAYPARSGAGIHVSL